MPPNEPTDADDVRRTLSGDREAFGRLYDRYARQIRAVVAAVSGNFGEVDDMTQETFLRAYHKLPALRDADKFRGWLHGIARFVASERRRQLSHDPVQHESDAIQIARDATDAIQHTEEQHRMLTAVTKLPERERLAIHAYFFHEQNAEEAAAAMQVSRSGFYAALDRALKHLRKHLGVSASPPAARNEK